MNARQEIKQAKLWIYLNTLNTELANKCLHFINTVSPILESIQTYFPFYTDHGPTHSCQVVNRMTDIIYDGCTTSDSDIAFSETEVFLLICSAYGHDIGMAILPGEEDDLLHRLNIDKEGNWEIEEKLQAELRKTHSIRGRNYITEENINIGIPLHLTGILSDLMEAHNYSINDFRNKLSNRRATQYSELDIQQLASILCISDVLEYSETRVKANVIKQIKDAIQENDTAAFQTSLRENIKHVCIGNNVAVGSDGKIIITGSFTDPNILNLAHQTVDYIEKWVNDYIDFDYQSIKKRIKVRSGKADRHFDIKNYDFERLGIRINHKRVIDLISSNAIWNSSEQVIRELLQNSIEACRYRKHYSSTADNYMPKITVIFNPAQNTIQITDNGCGMDRNIIMNNFLTVGNSRANEPNYQTNSYNSLARFGIGFWSVFTIAKRAEIVTAPFIPGINSSDIHGISFEVSIEAFKDYTLFSREKYSSGTSITLHLKDGFNQNSLFNEVVNSKRVIVCSEIPVAIKYEETVHDIPLNVSFPSRQKIFGAKFNFAKENNFKTFFWGKDIGDYEFKLFITYRIDIDYSNISFHFNKERISQFLHAERYTVTCICGFWMEVKPTFPVFEILGYPLFCYIANCRNPKGFAYNINRKELIKTTPEYEQYSYFIYSSSIEGYRIFLKEKNAYLPEKIFWLYYESITAGLGRGEPRFDKSEELKRLANIAGDLYVFQLCELKKDKDINTCEIQYQSFNELVEQDYKIYFIEPSMHMYRQVFPNSTFNYNLYDESKNYKFLNEAIEEVNAYYSWRDCQLLFDNDPTSYIQMVTYAFSEERLLKIPFLVVNTQSVSFDAHKDSFIGEIFSGRGRNWLLYKKNVKGGQFAIHAHAFYIDLESSLYGDIIELYNAGKHGEVLELIEKLLSSLFGFISDDIRKYM